MVIVKLYPHECATPLTKVTKTVTPECGRDKSEPPPSAARCSRFLMGAESKSDTPLAGRARDLDGIDSRVCLTSLSSLALICPSAVFVVGG